jgi:hypothetical protein
MHQRVNAAIFAKWTSTDNICIANEVAAHANF